MPRTWTPPAFAMSALVVAALAAPPVAGAQSLGPEAALLSPHAVPAGVPRERVLFDFQGGNDAQNPASGLARGADGALYGVARGGGSSDYGTVFKLTPSKNGYAESLVYTFSLPKDGYDPNGPLLIDRHGVIYGTAAQGGLGAGVVFTLTPAAHGYAYAIAYGFQQRGDGALPVGGVIMDRTGALYGVTELGGFYDYGTVYRLAPAAGGGYRESILYTFHGTYETNVVNDGMYPVSGLTFDASGALYGTTMQGGGFCVEGVVAGCGTVYKLTPTHTGYEESLLYTFHDPDNAGASPRSPVVLDAKGRLYGTAAGVGIHFDGTVYRLTPSGGGYAEETLYAFAGLRDGKFPSGPVLLGANGTVFGAAQAGGDNPACTLNGGCGTVYKLTPQANGTYHESSLYRFAGGKDGAYPSGPLLLQKNALLGVTAAGGSMNCAKELPGCGTAFSVLVP